MLSKRYLTLSELLQVIRYEQQWSCRQMAAECKLPIATYRRLERESAPSRELFDTLVDNLPALAVCLLGRKSEHGGHIRDKVRALEALPVESQLIELARIRFSLNWDDE